MFKNLISDVKIPVLGMGTWGMGGRSTANRSQDRIAVKALREGIKLSLAPSPFHHLLSERPCKALRNGIKLGMAHIDTAEMYGAGHSEELVGEAIKPFEREKIFITTKVSPENLRFDDLVNAAKRSLKRLQVDYIDLYLVHWPNPNIPLKETVNALEYIVEQGFTRFIGVSNFSVKLLEEARSYLSKQKIVANQVDYSLLHRDPERELLPYCQKEGIMLIAYTPLAKGRLAQPGFNLLDKIAEKYNKTQAQVALNWLISKERVIAIPKAAKIEHLKENFGAIGWQLSAEDIEKLDTRSF